MPIFQLGDADAVRRAALAAVGDGGAARLPRCPPAPPLPGVAARRRRRTGRRGSHRRRRGRPGRRATSRSALLSFRVSASPERLAASRRISRLTSQPARPCEDSQWRQRKPEQAPAPSHDVARWCRRRRRRTALPDDSNWQVGAAAVAGRRVLPSSHCSPAVTMPLPHAVGRAVAVAAVAVGRIAVVARLAGIRSMPLPQLSARRRRCRRRPPLTRVRRRRGRSRRPRATNAGSPALTAGDPAREVEVAVGRVRRAADRRTASARPDPSRLRRRAKPAYAAFRSTTNCAAPAAGRV